MNIVKFSTKSHLVQTSSISAIFTSDLYSFVVNMQQNFQHQVANGVPCICQPKLSWIATKEGGKFYTFNKLHYNSEANNVFTGIYTKLLMLCNKEKQKLPDYLANF